MSKVHFSVDGFTLSSPDPKRLAEFYSAMLGWEITDDQPDWVVLTNPFGGPDVNFHIEDVYERPVWPSEPGKQIMQAHLEIRVDDLEAAAERAQALGATQAEFQPQETVRVHLDPDGHPFCLFL
jgi:predicted enzyme related to lactoylglutathione lyase